MGVWLKDRSFGVGVLLATLFLVNYVNCQYYIEGSRPVYVIPEEEVDYSPQNIPNSAEPDVLRSRSGIDFQENSSEEDDTDLTQEEKDELGRASPVDLPEDFDESVKKNIAAVPQKEKTLHGDPGKIDEDDDEGRSAEARLLWPFSIELTKGKGANKGWGGPASTGHGSYTEWLSDGHGYGSKGHSHGWGGGTDGWHPYAGKYHAHGYPKGTFLTDDEVLSSKHYKKYRKKKKKKIKKLKKKLKFKRLVQKILQKHISYLDKVAPY